MKASIWYGAVAAVGSVTVTMSGQTEIPNGPSSRSNYIQTSKLVGRKVKSFDGKEIGVFKDIVIDRGNGCTAYTLLSTGGGETGVVSGGGKLVAVPWTVYSFTPDSSVLRVKVDRQKIYNAPAFDYTRIDEYARPDYIDNVYSYYGVSPGPHTAVAAGTDVTGTAGATASPGEVVSPAADGTGLTNKRPSEQTQTSSAESSHEAPSANSLPKSIRNARAIGSRPSIDPGQTASSMTTEKSPSDSAASLNENKKSRRKAIEDTSTRRPSATPESAEGQD